MGELDVWSLSDEVTYAADDIVGYAVAGADGVIGTVLKASAEPGRSYLILSARPWLDATMVMLPAGLVERVDHDQQAIAVAVTRDDVRHAPAFAADRYQDGAYRAEIAGYYVRDRLAHAVH